MVTTPYQSQRIALEQILIREAALIYEECQRDFRYQAKATRDTWLAKELADLQEWSDYLYRTHREKNLTGLGPDKTPSPLPLSKPFQRTLATLGDEAAGEDFCDAISALFIEIALIVAMQKTIGVDLGDYEFQVRRLLKASLPSVQVTGGSAGSSTAAATVAPPKNTP